MNAVSQNTMDGREAGWRDVAGFYCWQREIIMSIKNAKLVFNEVFYDVSARIWACEDNTFLFQCLKSNGKDLTVSCATLQNAMSLWEKTKARLDSGEG